MADSQRKILETFKSHQNLKKIIEKMAEMNKPHTTYYLLFTDKRKFFVSSIKRSQLERVFEKINTAYRNIPKGYWDFTGMRFHAGSNVWLDRPGEGSLLVYTRSGMVDIYGFGIKDKSFCRSDTLYKRLKEVFNLEGFYRVLRQEMKKRYSQ